MPEPIPTNKSAGRRRTAAQPAPQAPAPVPARAQQQRPDAGAQRRQQTIQARRLHDAWALGGFALIGITVLIPWLIGKYLLRDSSFFKQGQGVFDTSVRDAGKYFLSDYLSGLLIPGVIVAAFLLLRPWVRRAMLVVVGLGLVVAILVTLGIAKAKWLDNERLSAEVLFSGKYPFAARHGDLCLGGDAASKIMNGRVVSAGLRNGQSTDPFASHCNKIDVYQGWTQVAEFELPPDSYIEDSFFYAGGNAEPGWLVGLARGTSGKDLLFGVSLEDHPRQWQRPLPSGNTTQGSDANIRWLGNVVFASQEVAGNADLLKLTGFDMRTGGPAWTFSCASKFTAAKIGLVDEDGPDVVKVTCWNSRTSAIYLIGPAGIIRQLK